MEGIGARFGDTVAIQFEDAFQGKVDGVTEHAEKTDSSASISMAAHKFS